MTFTRDNIEPPQALMTHEALVDAFDSNDIQVCTAIHGVNFVNRAGQCLAAHRATKEAAGTFDVLIKSYAQRVNSLANRPANDDVGTSRASQHAIHLITELLKHFGKQDVISDLASVGDPLAYFNAIHSVLSYREKSEATYLLYLKVYPLKRQAARSTQYAVLGVSCVHLNSMLPRLLPISTFSGLNALSAASGDLLAA